MARTGGLASGLLAAALVLVGAGAVGGVQVSAAASTLASQSSTSVAPVASSGCQAAVAPASSQSTLSFSSVGESGTYIQSLPPSTEGPGHPTPVVFDLHGYVEPASFQDQGTELSAFGDSHGFVTITPQRTESGVPRWDVSARSPDIAYLGALLTHVESSLCVDQRRVFVTGLSMGAFASSAVACELSGRVAAVAPVAGLQAFSWCHPKRPVPVVAFQGTADPFVSYTGGPGPNALKLPAPDGSGKTVGQELKTHPHAVGNPLPQSIPTQVATWAKRNGCGTTPIKTSIASDVTRVTYPCPAASSVQFYVIKGGGHTWPGGPPGVFPASLVGKTTTSISANQIIWDFFQAHPLTGHVG
ncbi:MAG TPA: PHB depolymerase family esterase [Acidimicrobiales bacterium]|jgi:polyhydroxybutyrate depolymerase|nr:PHB depolymerase family esterase [Acidimicrobiales bacterium]